MDFWQVIEERYSVRAFDPDAEVSAEMGERLLQAAIQAPSAGGHSAPRQAGGRLVSAHRPAGQERSGELRRIVACWAERRYNRRKSREQEGSCPNMRFSKGSLSP